MKYLILIALLISFTNPVYASSKSPLDGYTPTQLAKLLAKAIHPSLPIVLNEDAGINTVFAFESTVVMTVEYNFTKEEFTPYIIDLLVKGGDKAEDYASFTKQDWLTIRNTAINDEKVAIFNNVCTNPAMQTMINRGVSVKYLSSYSDGSFMYSLKVGKSDCK